MTTPRKPRSAREAWQKLPAVVRKEIEWALRYERGQCPPGYFGAYTVAIRLLQEAGRPLVSEPALRAWKDVKAGRPTRRKP